jgi:hypothetical protein
MSRAAIINQSGGLLSPLIQLIKSNVELAGIGRGIVSRTKLVTYYYHTLIV